MVCRRIALSIVAVTAFLVAPATLRAQQPTEPKASDPTTVAIGDKSIGGTVTSRFGPEAGVWIIAETRDLGTRFAKIVVTDERGRYVVPDLPKASYRLWVRRLATGDWLATGTSYKLLAPGNSKLANS